MLAVLSPGVSLGQAGNAGEQSSPTGHAAASRPAPATDPKEQRKKELADDTAKLLQLAKELKAEVDKSTKDTLSLTVIKKAAEVEKLAHKVRDEMKMVGD